LADQGIEKNTILTVTLKEYDDRAGMDLSGSGNGLVASPLEHCNEYLRFIKGG
jgi:hypothetical protein